MSAKGTVVRDDESRYGLRRLHVVRAGQAPVCDEWLAEVGVGEEDLLARLEYEEQEVGMWHLRVYWKPLREEHPQLGEIGAGPPKSGGPYERQSPDGLGR